MKSPRELLLQKHHDAESKLAKIDAEKILACARVLADAENSEHASLFDVRQIFRRFWREAIFPWRRAWLGMAMTWVAILILRVSSGDNPGATIAKSSPPSPQMMVALLEQRKLLAQLLEAVPPQRSQPRIPGPRSEMRLEEVVV